MERLLSAKDDSVRTPLIVSNLPQTVGDEVSAEINALIAASDRLREWNSQEVRAVFRRIEQLQKVDARGAFIFFGALAAICGEIEHVSEYYRKALYLGNEAETKYEFWISMGNAALYSRAHEIGAWLLDPKRGFFLKMWKKALSLGQVRAVLGRLPEAKRTYPELTDEDFSVLENAAHVMGDTSLTDEKIAAVFDAMGEIQRTHRIMFSGRFVSELSVMRPPDEPAYLYFQIRLDTSVGEIHGMNRDLARMIVAQLPEGAFPPGMVASFAKAEPAELRAAA